MQDKIAMPINVIYQERITESGIYKVWEGQKKEAGEAEICCENYKQEWELGNIHQTTMHEICTGEKYEKVRKAHQNGEWWKTSSCRKCTIPHMDKEIR